MPETHAHGQLRHGGAHGRQHGQGEAHTVFQAAAVDVRTLVAQGRKKLVHQIAVGRVQFNGVVARLRGALGRLGKGGCEPLQVGGAEGRGGLVAGGVGQGRGSTYFPAALVRGKRSAAFPGATRGPFAARITQLHGNGRAAAALADKLQHGFVCRLLRFVPKTKVVGRNAPGGFHRRGLHNKQTRAGKRQMSVVHTVPGHRASVLGGILVHGRDNNAVGQIEAADGNGGKQRVHSASWD